MKKYTFLVFTLLFIVSCVLGMKSGKFLNFSNKKIGFMAENSGVSFIRNKTGNTSTNNSWREALDAPDSSRFTRIILAQGFDE
ncbi:MAG TPA: hypothetical protein PLT16_08025, partial [Daejeonella sp.]|nr:hypothetical protein [Daejeonella sp.]